jgi:Rrf2 family cysteine metabolism transcriptional repressor
LTFWFIKRKFPVTDWEFMNSLFRVSERNHFGLIFMTQLAALPADGFLSVKEAAKAMGMAEGYLEEVAGSLKKAGLVAGRQGPGGGYKLAKPAQDITAEEIVVALEGPVSLVPCLEAHGCPVESKCQSKKLWGFLQKDVLETLRKTKLDTISV